MIVYIPTPITSVEQAEQLPEGSFVLGVQTGFEYRARHALGGYLQHDLDAGDEVLALVPIEAEEETSGWGYCTSVCPRVDHDHADQIRYVTEWLPGPSPDRRGDCA